MTSVVGAAGVPSSFAGDASAEGVVVASTEGVAAGGATVSFETTGGAAFSIVRVVVCAGASTAAAVVADESTVFCGAGVGTRSSGDAGCWTVPGSTTGAGCGVDPGASVLGSAPTPLSVVAGDAAEPIAMGVPVSSVVTVAFAIAVASASTTGADVYAVVVGEASDGDGDGFETNE